MRTRQANWFETKIKYQRTMEDGSERVVSELYVVDALTCTEAENKIIDEMSAYISGENKVTRTSEAAFGEVFFSDNDEDDKWYKAKLQFITLDEKTEKERRTNVTYLVQAKSLARALRYVDEAMGKTMIDYDTVGLNETKVMDVFKRSSPSDENKKDNE